MSDRAEADLKERRDYFLDMCHPKRWHRAVIKPLPGHVWKWHNAEPWWAWQRRLPYPRRRRFV